MCATYTYRLYLSIYKFTFINVYQYIHPASKHYTYYILHILVDIYTYIDTYKQSRSSSSTLHILMMMMMMMMMMRRELSEVHVQNYLLGFGALSKVDGFPIGEEVEGIEERESFAAGLMDRDYHCPSSLR